MSFIRAILIASISSGLIACGNPAPVPDKAIQACIESDGMPLYRSNPIVVEFTCKKIKPPPPPPTEPNFE